MSSINIAAQQKDEQDKVNVDLAASGVQRAPEHAGYRRAGSA